MIYYQNSHLQKFELDSENVRILETNLHSYDYSPDATAKVFGDSFNGFKKKSYSIPAVLTFRGTKRQRIEELERFHEIISIDVVEEKTGKLVFGDYYLNCYIMSEKIYPEETTTTNEVKIYAPYPFWIKETKYNFNFEKSVSEKDKKYSGRYPYRYINKSSSAQIINNHYAEVNFLLRIYGPCVEPSVGIGENHYKLNLTLNAGEYVEIDTRSKTIVKVEENGLKTNEFNSREKGVEFFKKIKPGLNNISFGQYLIDIITFEERSIPKW